MFNKLDITKKLLKLKFMEQTKEVKEQIQKLQQKMGDITKSDNK